MRLLVAGCLAAVGCRIGFDAGATTDASGDGRGAGDAGDAGEISSSAILFVRGGAGTVGLNNTGGDTNACDTNENINGEGWGKLAALLVTLGFTVEERDEGPVTARAPVDLTGLDGYGILVLGSNNFAYAASAADQVESYVRRGGAVLFISDAGWCKTTFDEAPSSDQTFADRFDLVIDQDNRVGTPTTTMRASFAQPAHPVLAGVNSYRSIGTSPISVVDLVADVTPVVLVPATGTVYQNDGPNGTTRPAAAGDGQLVVADVGLGRVAGYFDRDTWTNATLNTLDDKALATNLFEWLAHRL